MANRNLKIPSRITSSPPINHSRFDAIAPYPMLCANAECEKAESIIIAHFLRSYMPLLETDPLFDNARSTSFMPSVPNLRPHVSNPPPEPVSPRLAFPFLAHLPPSLQSVH